jgi:hypothetical protein
LNEIPQVEESKSKFRLIFLNLLISFFIIISYVNIAEISGSISTLYILNNDLILRFGFTLTIFTFLSVVAGPVHGLVDGFIAELLYQIAFYHEIYIEWCVIVAILGFLVGLYKYKPLKYHKGTKVYYTFLQLVISSFIIMGFIILLQFLFYPNQFTAEIIIINFGIKFLIQALVSIIKHLLPQKSSCIISGLPIILFLQVIILFISNLDERKFIFVQGVQVLLLGGSLPSSPLKH